ncbi:thiamine pyrophosphate-binding protein [Actinomadura sp. 3N508]|uniref:thiamine pyrophosphate-binding protein n=1 Tax=Actinomadura sp. 3N508 TaxID=3375153 RepID=UPI0037A6A862
MDEPVVNAPTRPAPTAAATVVAALEHAGIRRAVGVPDSQLAAVLDAMSERMPVTFTAREDVAVAMAVGADLAGERYAVFMKNAGLGTSLDAIVSLAFGADVPLTLVIGWAGAGADKLPHHTVMGDRTLPLLTAVGIEHDIVPQDGADPSRCRTRAAACRTKRRPYALLVEP